MEVNSAQGVEKSEIIELSNEQKKISIPILETYRGGFSVNFYTVKQNRHFHQFEAISVPWTNKVFKKSALTPIGILLSRVQRKMGIYNP